MNSRIPSVYFVVTLSFGFALEPAVAKTLNAVASFTVLADVVREVGGAHVRVRSLVGTNGDPHEFSPNPDDARSLKEADVSFISGEGLEGWFERLAQASGAKASPVVASTGIKTHDAEQGGKLVTDPHVWNSAANVIIWVANIESALMAVDPEDAVDFKANAARYSSELRELHSYAQKRIGAVPTDKRKVLTSHNAFGYFGKEYGVTFLAPIGISTEAEPSASDVARLITQIKRERIKVYFLENSNDPRLVKQIAKATGAEPGGDLYVESLSADDGPAPTYAKMFRTNVDKIADAMAK